ncbi:putative glycosyltransferase [Chloropicon primus]|uniref:Putative glycosyltransferase n=2 Tax=Chloropicon primus TaxID=1764295 RepID=A0A5B8MD94_9CHLO|nr:putative glycosyltransferase [Chloropicon primus]UPQ97735.1 putative glycosyltransferase [Chloropicon primus]|eukprot:QDZ18526.1 putative glycosyltransferase [Chloropicon primus]
MRRWKPTTVLIVAVALVVAGLAWGVADGSEVPLQVEERCPGACGGRGRGICTKTGCSCLAGHGGLSCQDEGERAEAVASRGEEGLGTRFGRARTVCVASSQVPHASLSEEVAFAIPGFPVASDLAARGYLVTLVFLALNGGPDRRLVEGWTQQLASDNNIELKVLSKTQHYYMPSTASQSFSLYAFLRDRVREHGLKPFDLVMVHDGHGLGYYLGLAKGQDERRSGLEGTKVHVNLVAPHLWLVTEGAEFGVTSVDDIEIDFMEKEAVRLADHVSVQHGSILAWCEERKWKFPGNTGVGAFWPQHHRPGAGGGTEGEAKEASGSGVPSMWQSVDLGRKRERDATRPSRQGSHLVVVVQGPGGGRQGAMVSSGGNKRSSTNFQVSEEFKYEMMERDLDTLEDLAWKLATDEAAAGLLKGVTVLLAGIEDRSLPLQMKRRIAQVGSELEAAIPGLSFSMRACRYSEALQFLEQEGSGEDFKFFAALAEHHRDLLTFDWLHKLASQGWETVFLSNSSATQEILASSVGHRAADTALAESVDGVISQFVRSSREPREREGPRAPGASGFLSNRVMLQALSFHNPALPAKMQSVLAEQTCMSILKTLVGGHPGARRGSSPGREEFLHATALPFVSVVITHYNRPDFLEQAVKSVTYQSYPEELLELIVIDDGSPDAGIREKLVSLSSRYLFQFRGWSVKFEPNRYLGGARNAGAGYAKGKYILFMDDDNYAKSYEVEHFVRAMEGTHADVMTSGLDFITGKYEPPSESCSLSRHKGKHLSGPSLKSRKCIHRESKMSHPFEEPAGNRTSSPVAGRASPSFVFLGASSNVGLFKNCYGDANSFFRSESFRDLGGYTTDRHVGYEDWEFYSKAALGGFNLQTVPRAMYFYRFTSGSMQKTTSYRQSRKRALRAYTG